MTKKKGDGLEILKLNMLSKHAGQKEFKLRRDDNHLDLKRQLEALGNKAIWLTKKYFNSLQK